MKSLEVTDVFGEEMQTKKKPSEKCILTFGNICLGGANAGVVNWKEKFLIV